MTVYLDLVILLNFIVDLLLLLGTNRLCGAPPGILRAAMGASLGGIYAGVCMLPGFSFLGNWLWRVIFLLLISFLAFGFKLGALRRCSIFFLLSMSLGGVAIAMGESGIGALFAAAGLVLLLCFAGFRKRIGGASYVPVQIRHNGKKMSITAMEDTGNTLRDPITGRPVLVVSSAIAQSLLGLTEQQLRDPVKTMAEGAIPGLRLIPFSTVGSAAQLLLAMRIGEVKIGNWKGSSLVAFAPVGLDREGTYQALTGGAL